MINPDTFFRLHLSDNRTIRYYPYISKMVWDDSDEPITPLLEYDEDRAQTFRPAFKVSPTNPGIKKGIKVIKLQMGMKCNFACSYCNQASQPHEIHGSISDVDITLKRVEKLFGEGDGAGFRLEFWGGEPFVYWKVLEPLAYRLIKRYPKASYNIISNGSLIDEEKIQFFEKTGIGLGVSHDGPGFKMYRDKVDPLEHPVQLHWLREAYRRLGPESGRNQMSFNCVLTAQSYSLFDVRMYIAERLGVPAGMITLVTEEIVLPYDVGGMLSSPRGEELAKIMRNIYREFITGDLGFVSSVISKLMDFYKSIETSRPADALSQKCGMDRDDTIAFNMKGDVLTCHNTSPNTKHQIGHVDKLDEVRLNTSHHFSTREECVRCPVVQLCRGACMYNEGELWKQSCDNSFYWNLGILAIFINKLTGAHLVSVSGDVIRRDGEPSTISVIEANNEV
jgi:uncharacterized protein